MFLHLSVSHSVHGGVSASVHAGIHPLGRHSPPPPGQTPLQQTVTAADGTHPSGMNSCSVFFFSHETADVFDACRINSCSENSRCVKGDCQYTCVCNEGYVGASCETGTV